ncbi:CBS domain-containing protein, partial [Streptomyces sp. NPDC127164]|uniref:CBS domain-containing protein n=1 Tax=Streptomyces sp. NPDC127164 TaxID=3345379 RepID=UPI00362F2CAF
MTRIRDVMSPAPVAVEPMTTVTRAARLMREEDVGDVLVTYDRDLFGVLTDRDIVLRGVADGRDPDTTTVGSVCSPPPVVTLGRRQISACPAASGTHARRVAEPPTWLRHEDAPAPCD